MECARERTLVNTRTDDLSIDLQKAISTNRLLGLWRLMKGYRLVYLSATVTLVLAATLRR